MSTIAKIYTQSFNRRPNLTLSLTNGSLSAVADTLAQTINPEVDGSNQTVFNKRRTLNFFIFGAALGSPLNYWNKFLEFKFPLKISPTSSIRLNMLFKRVALDQTVMAPTGLTAFITIIGTLEGRSGKELKYKFEDLFVTALLANWKVWPLIQLFNFRFCPLAFRVPFTGACGTLWTVYLSVLNSKKSLNEVPSPVTIEKKPSKHQWEEKPTGEFSKAEIIGVAR